MSAPLDELYFQWLYEQVADPGFDDQELTYWKILRILYKKEFVWLVANDENRIHDGFSLRAEFLGTLDFPHGDSNWMELSCSVLELMVGLARRLAFEADSGETHYWFWILMDNIGFSGYNDRKRFTKRQFDRIDDTLDSLIYRNYEPNGLGGFFPLEYTRYDQRGRELWYQMSEYILERKLAG